MSRSFGGLALGIQVFRRGRNRGLGGLHVVLSEFGVHVGNWFRIERIVWILRHTCVSSCQIPFKFRIALC